MKGSTSTEFNFRFKKKPSSCTSCKAFKANSLFSTSLMRCRGENQARRRRKVSGNRGDEEAIKHSESCSCNSCAAAAVADIIAVSCCPCAVLSFLVLAFFKLPCAAGRRCMRIIKRRGALEEGDVGMKWEGFEDKNVELRVESLMGMGIGDMMDERGWKEMYQVGQWGFGRVSVSGSEA